LQTKSSLLVKLAPFDKDAINAEFQEEYLRIEARGHELDLMFHKLLRELRIWLESSINPLTVEAKARYVPVFVLMVELLRKSRRLRRWRIIKRR
jgi:hypothetical protein